MQPDPDEESRRSLAIVVLAAGLGTRMKSKIPKVLHEICGKPMIVWVSEAIGAVAPDRTLVVLGDGVETVHQVLPQFTEAVRQERQLGTGDAVRAAQGATEGFEGCILGMSGDTPLVNGEALGGLLWFHLSWQPRCALSSVSVT